LPITVLVADRRRAASVPFLRRLRDDPALRIVGEARTGGEMVAVTSALKPRVLLLGDSVRHGDLHVALALVRRKSRRTRVIVVGHDPSGSALLEAAVHGARGWLATTSTPGVVSKAIRAVAGGQAWLPRRLAADVLARLGGDAAPPLSERH
jgi:DNA-binding NarL/FixJ family response regulator